MGRRLFMPLQQRSTQMSPVSVLSVRGQKLLLHYFSQYKMLEPLFELLQVICRSFDCECSMTQFSFGAGYSKKRRKEMNFVIGEAKCSISKSRQNRTINEVVPLFVALAEVWADFTFSHEQPQRFLQRCGAKITQSALSQMIQLLSVLSLYEIQCFPTMMHAFTLKRQLLQLECTLLNHLPF